MTLRRNGMNRRRLAALHETKGALLSQLLWVQPAQPGMPRRSDAVDRLDDVELGVDRPGELVLSAAIQLRFIDLDGDFRVPVTEKFAAWYLRAIAGEWSLPPDPVDDSVILALLLKFGA